MDSYACYLFVCAAVFFVADSVFAYLSYGIRNDVFFKIVGIDERILFYLCVALLNFDL